MNNKSNSVFEDACRILRAAGDGVYVSDAKHISEMLEYFEETPHYESAAQRQEVEEAATTLILCSLASTAIWDGLPGQPDEPNGVIDLSAFVRSNGASDRLLKFAAATFADTSDFGDSDVEQLRDAAYQRLSAALNTPSTIAWRRASELIQAAIQDPLITGNLVIVQFLERMNELALGATGAMRLEGILKPLWNEIKSDRGRYAASQKNAKPRAWVLNAWVNRKDQGQSKAAFARQYALLVKKQYSLAVTAETIARDWLNRANK